VLANVMVPALTGVSEMDEYSANWDGMTLFCFALKRRCKACIDKALLIWVEELQGCEGGYISWEGDLPTAENLRLSDLFYLVSSSDEWYKDDFQLNINNLMADYADYWWDVSVPACKACE